MIKNLRKTRVLVGLGANMPSSLGTPKQTLAAALERLEDEGVSELESSQFYRTPCFPIGAGPDYVNACASFLSDQPPQRLLALLHAIEAEFGRQRDQRWGQRSLDLDLLAYGDDVRPDLSIYTAWKDLPMEA
ncbi:MAG: 2-amino-4-hydroxy-6-hydroxymethyldihydropteridine diphosphokinase, partial [Pseudomonadota bacterium]